MSEHQISSESKVVTEAIAKHEEVMLVNMDRLLGVMQKLSDKVFRLEDKVWVLENNQGHLKAFVIESIAGKKKAKKKVRKDHSGDKKKKKREELD